MKLIEQIGKILPIGSLLIILCSSSKLVIYYNFFNVSIVDFIGIQEIITSFIDDILYYLALFSISLILYLNSENLDNNNNNNIDYSNYKKQRRIIIVIIVVIIIISSILFFYFEKNHEKATFICGSLFIVFSMFYTYSTYTSKPILYPVFIFSGILLYTITSAFSGAYKIIENDNTIDYLLIFKGRKIETNENIKFIGNTEKYYFLYNIKSEKTSILNGAEIEEIGIIKKKKNILKKNKISKRNCIMKKAISNGN